MKKFLLYFLLLPLIAFGQPGTKLIVKDGKILMRPAATVVTKKIQVFYLSMSIGAGVGTDGTGSSASGLYNGPNSYPVKADSLLMTVNGLNVTGVFRVFPGETAAWYINNDLTTTISLFDYDHYTDIYCVIDFGTNDLASGFTAAGVLTNIEYIAGRLKAAGAKVLVMPVLNRKDAAAPSGLSNRGTYNTSLFANYGSFADGICDVSIYSNIYSDSAPDNATYFAAPDLDGSSKVHPTSAGAYYIAQSVQTAVAALSSTTSIPIIPVDYAGNFITATGITDGTQQSVIRTLVRSLIDSNLWHKFKAIYPFVGGTATTHKYNLKDPRDLDSAFRLTYSGTATHNSNGVTWSTSAWSDTHILPVGNSMILAQQQALVYYSRNTPSTSGGDMGMRSSNPLNLFINFAPNGRFDEISENSASAHSVSYIDTGMFIITRPNDPAHKYFYRNSTLIASASTNVNSGNTFYSMWLGGVNNNGTNSWGNNRNCAFAAFGYGLTAREVTALYTIVQAYETTLSRQK